MVWPAILIGLMGSVHCVGMCGPLAMAIPVARKRRILSIVLYHSGRIATYAVIGGVFGLLGTGFRLMGFQSYLSIITGVFILFLVAYPAIKRPLHRWFSLDGRKIRSILGRFLKDGRPFAVLGMGALNGLLPCGLVYVAVAGALETGYVETASLYMIFFGLGTVPLLSLPMISKPFLVGFRRFNTKRLIAAFTLLLGVLFILRGVLFLVPEHPHESAIDTIISSITGCHDL